VDILAVLIKRAQEEGLLTGLGTYLIEGGVAILQYSDDTILLLEDNLDHARNLKVILCLFEQILGLKIKFHKSDIYCLEEASEREGDFERIFTCKSGLLPVKYLGVPINKKRLRNYDWDSTEGKMRSKLGPWQGKMLVMGGRVTLINSSLTSVPLYMLSFYRIPSGVKEKMDRIRNIFLWDETEDKNKYNLFNWQTVCIQKD
jgi:hypothetical protein